jgi:hypothetical protein
MRNEKGFMMTVILILLIRAYRLIPAPVRRTWSLGCSTSGGYLAELQAGNVTGLAALRLIAAALVPHAGGWDEARPGG